jgi:hypothetical protein
MNKLLLCLPVVALACAPAEPSPDEELCEHMAEGPAIAVTAGADLDGAPDVSDEHTRYDVAVDDEGVVAYASAEATELLVALGEDVDVTFLQGDVELAIEESRGSDACEEVGRVHLIDVEVGTVEIRLGPTDATEVSIVIEHAAHEDEA